ncbi:DUF4158 domain-containing protein [Streptosporangium roseum]|uniref:Transposase Tn3 family protein n=1 Tax=Streptosporangium roseum (strain ATCC 12428 / DSM 43021 / JCM 3005 / KCTC 9067 / NCIMB 10171 / NRRL 2505 / NI 9100) TaxID=479432 RepID=D2AW67_STRRD|nr:DUF4158 domain-containing protein [Streptosporangium roseum]ACZ85020.1 transposase Tn3 family protein [Streptosporangium roseum DSM 43021]
MRREWELDELIECWTLDEDELGLLSNKSGATRLGFALLLKFFELEGRFPRREDVPKAAVEYMAGQVGVEAALLFADYQWSGRTIEYHRSQVRKHHGFRQPTVADEDKQIFWLAGELCPEELSRDRLRAALLTRFRAEKIEPPTPVQVDRLLGAAVAMFERDFTTRTAQRLGSAAGARLDDLIAAPEVEADPVEVPVAAPGRSFLQELKEDPGPIQLDTLLAEIVKLERVRAIGLGEGLFEGVSEKIVESWRARAMRMYPSDFAAAAEPVRWTLLAALCWVRKTELTDGLVELLIQLVHKISVRAERKVESEISAEFRRVHGKNGILVRLAQAALDLPEEVVREAIYPVVGARTLADIVAEAKANEKVFNSRVRTKLRGSYSRHYRRGLPKLLRALEFGCSNTAFRPVMDALALLDRYADSEAVHYDRSETVPLEHVVPDDWKDAVVDPDTGRVERIPYELCVLVALHKAIRRREIWITGAKTWRNPDDDLPADYENNRDVHYEALSKPRDPAAFIADLQRRHLAALDRLNTAMGSDTTGGVKLTRRKGEPWISVPPLNRRPEPTGLVALKEEISRRWGVIDLLDVLKDVDHVTGFTKEFTSVASRTITHPDVLQRRLLLCLYGLGTNVGIKRVADGAVAAGLEDSEAVLRRIRRLLIRG